VSGTFGVDIGLEVSLRPIEWPRNRLNVDVFFDWGFSFLEDGREEGRGYDNVGSGDGFSTADQLPLGLWENCQDLPMGLILGVD